MKRALPIRRSIDALTKAAGFSLEGRPFTARAVADLCGVELKTVHNWVLEGRLEHFRTPGRHLRFQRVAVQKFLLSCGYEPPVESTNQTTVLVVKGGSSAALRTVLRGQTVTEVEDLPSALIVAARSDPTMLIVDLTSPGSTPDAATLLALARLTPALRVVLFGKSNRQKPRRLHGAEFVEGVPNLMKLVQGSLAADRHRSDAK